ncbi:MAG: hypothetical protein ABI822_18520, partial [Bryobacteraceae bacterium]
MKFAAILLTALSPLLLGADEKAAPPAAVQSDPVLRAMSDELARAKLLSVANLDVPYYIEYSLDDAENFSVSASLGGLLSARRAETLLLGPNAHHPAGEPAGLLQGPEQHTPRDSDRRPA